MIITFDRLAQVEAEEATPETRTIKGTAVPWNQVGTVSDGTSVRFLPGSLDAEARPVVTLGHDGNPIGKVVTNSSSDTGMATAVRVSRTRDGDEALVLASDGVLGMFSVGVNPTEFSYEDDTLVIAKGEWHHLALLPFGAFSDAVVTDVAASAPTQGATVTMTDDSIDTTSSPPEVTAAPSSGSQPPPAVIPVTAARPAAPPLTLERIATLVASANRGEISTESVKATLQAALTNVTSTNIGSTVIPFHRQELTAIIDHGTPLLTVLGGGTLPPSGLSIEYPQWDSAAPNGGKPTTGVQATEKTAIVSTAVKMAMKSAPVVTIAGGNDISLQAVERSSPSFLNAYLAAAATDWGRKAEAYVLSILTPLCEVVAPGASFLANVQALMASLDPAQTPAGPLFVGMSYDVAMPLISVTTQNGPAFWDGSISFGSMTPTVNADALNLFIDWNLPAKTMLAGSTSAATVYKSAGAPADIRVVDVSLLGLDVGVYGYLAVTVDYPGALSIMTLP
jgi:hypothetical protein